MDNSFSDAGDQLFELGQSVKKKFIKDVVKGVAQSAKNQIVGEPKAPDDTTKKNDPVTNKPVPSQKVLSQLTQATKQLQMTKLQKIREELDKQRLKVTGADSAKASSSQGKGPELPADKPKPSDDAVSKNLRNSQSTGEARGDMVG